MKKEQQNKKKVLREQREKGMVLRVQFPAYVIAKLVNENLRCGLNLN